MFNLYLSLFFYLTSHFSIFYVPLGCGNVSGDMYSAGYHTIINIDYSTVCISAMSAKYCNCPGMTWHQMDIRQLSFPDASFDVILEKATLDALMVEEKTPWEVSSQTACFIHQTLTEVCQKRLCCLKYKELLRDLRQVAKDTEIWMSLLLLFAMATLKEYTGHVLVYKNKIQPLHYTY